MFCSSLCFLFRHLSLSFYYPVEENDYHRIVGEKCVFLFFKLIEKYQIGGIWYNGSMKSSGSSDFGGWERVMFHHMGIRMSVVFKEETNC